MSDDTGGDVADSRSPDAIQREIEATRAELADTIDAIAERVSPKKAASRGAKAVKAQVSAAIGQVSSTANNALPPKPKPTDAADALDAVDTTEYDGLPATILDATPEQAARHEPVAVVSQRSLRTDRVLLTVGAAAAALGAVVLLRNRRH